MMSRAFRLSLATATLLASLPTWGLQAYADDGVGAPPSGPPSIGQTPDGVEATPQPTFPLQGPRRPDAQEAAEAAKGPPGMMGLPWPKSPEEAQKTIGNLLAHLATTNDPLLAGAIAVSIEKLWRLPGGDTVNLLLDRAAEFSAKNENEKALKLLDAASELAPDYAEVWNRRAYAYYRLDNTSAALGDLRRTLALEPNHFRALDGMAKILEGLGEKKAALKAYDQLLKIYPKIEGAERDAEELRKAVEGQGI